MRNRLIKSLVVLLLTATSLQASAARYTYTSQVFRQNQTSDGQLFDFIINNAPLADLVDGSLYIRARGDFSEDSNIENMVVNIDDATQGNASPWDGGSIVESYHFDVVEWSQEFVLSGSDLVSWTNDQKIVITLDLSEDVEYNLFADGFTKLYPPFVEATLVYETSVIPLPTATWLFLSGLIGILGYGRKRKST
ncbi:MAG: hypothetical protein BVN35_15905 [Proteobacteria bacterium ST_bin11]|nr:MAG: hypothetical protein BVN35_15905 [Proteobacteria bacterium ST_bin11]